MGTPLSVGQYPAYASVGALVAFGSMNVAIPFILNFFALPSDLFQLYVLGSVITSRLATALAAMHGVVVCLLGAVAITGGLRIKPIARAAGFSIAVTAVVTLVLGFILTRVIPYEYTGEDEFVDRSLAGDPVAAIENEQPVALSSEDLVRPRLAVVRSRGTLRVGYAPNRLPFAYRNNEGGTIGLDADLVNRLARDLGVTLEGRHKAYAAVLVLSVVPLDELFDPILRSLQ